MDDAWRDVPLDVLQQVQHGHFSDSRWVTQDVKMHSQPKRSRRCTFEKRFESSWYISDNGCSYHHFQTFKGLDDVVQVTGLLDLRDLQAARMVCKQWQLGLSIGVTKLRPRMEANAVGLQWVELHKLQVSLITALRKCNQNFHS